MKLYPIFANIENRLAVVIGGGEVAFRKAKDLLDAGAKIKIISPQIHGGFEELKKNNVSKLEIIIRTYSPGDIDGAYLVFAATNDPDVNRLIFVEAEEKGILINSVDDPPNCSYYVPSMVRQEDLIIAVSTSGASPAMAARLRRLIEKSIPNNIEKMLSSLREARTILKKFENLTFTQRGQILKKIVNNDALLNDLIEHQAKGQIANLLKSLL